MSTFFTFFFIKAASNLVVITFTFAILSVILMGLYHTGLYALTQLLISVLTTWLPTAARCLAAGVIFFTHPVHSLLALIVIFFLTVIIYLRAGTEFLAFTFLIVYVGAVAILFLFVIRLLNVKELISSAREHLSTSQKAASASASRLVPQTQVNLTRSVGVHSAVTVADTPATVARLAAYVSGEHSDITKISSRLYTHHSPLLRVITLLLLTARLGAIVLATGLSKKELVARHQFYHSSCILSLVRVGRNIDLNYVYEHIIGGWIRALRTSLASYFYARGWSPQCRRCTRVWGANGTPCLVAVAALQQDCPPFAALVGELRRLRRQERLYLETLELGGPKADAASANLNAT